MLRLVWAGLWPCMRVEAERGRFRGHVRLSGSEAFAVLFAREVSLAERCCMSAWPSLLSSRWACVYTVLPLGPARRVEIGDGHGAVCVQYCKKDEEGGRREGPGGNGRLWLARRRRAEGRTQRDRQSWARAPRDRARARARARTNCWPCRLFCPLLQGSLSKGKGRLEELSRGPSWDCSCNGRWQSQNSEGSCRGRTRASGAGFILRKKGAAPPPCFGGPASQNRWEERLGCKSIRAALPSVVRRCCERLLGFTVSYRRSNCQTHSLETG